MREARKSEPPQQSEDGFRSDGAEHFHGGNVERVGERGARRDRAAVEAVEVAHARRVVRVGDVGYHRRRRGYSAFKGERVYEGLERRAGRARRGGAVHPRGLRARPFARVADVAAHLRRFVLDEHRRGGDALVHVCERGAQLREQQVLFVRVERRAEAPVFVEMFARAAVLRRRVRGLYALRGYREARFRQRFKLRAARLFLGRNSALGERVYEPVAQLERALRMAVGTVVARPAQQRGEQRRLGEREVLRGLAEPRARRSFDAARVSAEWDAVQVNFEDFVFCEDEFERRGLGEFEQLVRKRALARHGEADDLARYRRGSGDDAPLRHVLPHGARDGEPVHAAVRVEAPVLYRDCGGGHPAPHLRHRDGEQPFALGGERPAQRSAAHVGDDERRGAAEYALHRQRESRRAVYAEEYKKQEGGLFLRPRVFEGGGERA